MKMTIIVNGAEKDFATKAANYFKPFGCHYARFTKFIDNIIEIFYELHDTYPDGRLYVQTDITLFTLPEALGYKDYAVKFN